MRISSNPVNWLRRGANLAVCILLASAAAHPAFGWGCEGHQIIALIARAHLTPAASEAVDQLLRDSPIDPSLRRFCRDRSADPMADSSTWADDIKGIEKTGLWHYIDVPLSIHSGDAMKYCEPIGPPANAKERPGCVVNAIEYEGQILRDPARSAVERASALRYIVHFIGDLHQPLHTTDNNDKGGNCTSFQFFAEDKPSNLHSVWDYKIIARELAGMNLGNSPMNLARFATSLDARFDRNWHKWGENSGQVLDWIWEGHKLAENVVYGDLKPHIPVEETPNPRADCDAERAKVAALNIKIDDKYYAEAIPVIDERLARGGYRLAGFLNKALQ